MSKRKNRQNRPLITETTTMWIGKKGAESIQAEEVSKQLDKRKAIKIKILKSALINEDAKQIAQKIAEQTQSEIVDLRGHTFTVYRRKKAKKHL